jgi:hypothetical protein
MTWLDWLVSDVALSPNCLQGCHVMLTGTVGCLMHSQLLAAIICKCTSVN